METNSQRHYKGSSVLPDVTRWIDERQLYIVLKRKLTVKATVTSIKNFKLQQNSLNYSYFINSLDIGEALK